MSAAAPRRVYLHIGLPKTGTTYLQDAVWQNRDALESRGLFVPGVRRHHLLASLDFRDDPSLARRPRRVQHPWQYLVDQINAQTSDALISHEFLCPASAEHVPRAVESFPDAEVHVIITARGTVDLFVSRWQEWIKNGAHLSIDEYPRRKDLHGSWGWSTIDLAEVLTAWGSVIDPARLHIVPMRTDSGEPEDLWHRFLDVMGHSHDGLPPKPSGANQSLGIVEVEVLRQANKRLEGFTSPLDRGRWIRGHLAEGTIRGLGESEKFRPGAEKLRELLDREERTMDLLTTGGFDLRGDLVHLRSADVSRRRHPDQVGTDEVAELAARVIARLLEDVRDAGQADRAEMPPAADDEG